MPFVKAQTTFVKRITDTVNEHYCQSIKEGPDTKFYTAIVSVSPAHDTACGRIVKIDRDGTVCDSLDISNLGGKRTFYAKYIIKNYQGKYLFPTMIADSTHRYLYAMVFDTTLSILQEKLIDTLQNNEALLNHLTNRQGNNLFITGTYDTVSFMWEMFIYETDADFNLLRKIIPGFSDGGYSFCEVNNVGFVEMSIDSSYIITSYNWRLKLNFDLTRLDTLSVNDYGMVYSTFNNTMAVDDSTFLHNTKESYYVNPPYNPKNFPFLNRYNYKGVKIDSLMVSTPYTANTIVHNEECMSLISDTLYYCFQANQNFTEGLICVVKMSIAGDIYWQKYIDIPHAYAFGSVTGTVDGGCVMEWNINHAIYIIKIDKYGNTSLDLNPEIQMRPEQILLYPNPAADQITIETGLYQNLKIQVFDITGKLYVEMSLDQGVNRLDVSGFPAGVFMYRAYNQEKVIGYGKFVKE